MMLSGIKRSRWTRFWQPATGWLVLAGLYLVAAVLTVLLAVTMVAWWPLVLVAASVVAAARCVVAALDRRK
ncbi:hypothetical protein [Actinophytocola sp.]|uniref:hypothetical protein n=1 Tax=Actinophytocola sp. TaxID=1872138 RepID=UPI002D7F751F|nr:hypothetical protein [Actinophytocola sp.]HET9138852.1 hypothetical protein [Actinophytocola sp.]HEU5109740.1 hypothetical protein [Micromonosporaceae bacterium]